MRPSQRATRADLPTPPKATKVRTWVLGSSQARVEPAELRITTHEEGVGGGEAAEVEERGGCDIARPDRPPPGLPPDPTAALPGGRDPPPRFRGGEEIPDLQRQIREVLFPLRLPELRERSAVPRPAFDLGEPLDRLPGA